MIHKTILRGWLLRFLHEMPTGEDDGGRMFTSTELLQGNLKAAKIPVTRSDIDRELAYLQSKKYVELKKPTGAAARIFDGGVMVRITGDGVDVFEGTTEDKGVVIP